MNVLKYRLGQCRKYAELLRDVDQMGGLREENRKLLKYVLVRKIGKNLGNGEKYGGGALIDDIKKKFAEIQTVIEYQKSTNTQIQELIKSIDTIRATIENIDKYVNEQKVEKIKADKELLELKVKIQKLENASAKALSVREQVKTIEKKEGKVKPIAPAIKTTVPVIKAVPANQLTTPADQTKT